MAVNTPLHAWPFDFTQGNFITRVDYDANGNAIYLGWAQPGTVAADATWRIKQLTYNASNQFTNDGFPGDANANPSCAFSFVWNSRTTYTYS